MKLTLKAARVNVGLTQKRAAELLKLHPQTLAKWEADSSNMPYGKVKLIEEVYGVDEGVIFFGNQFELSRKVK